MLVSVAVYHVELCYGGPEEGGWYFQAGILSPCHPVMYFEAASKPVEGNPDNDWPEIEWVPTQEAKDARGIIQGFLDANENFGAPSLYASNSRGQFVAYIDIGHPSSYFPKERPHYE